MIRNQLLTHPVTHAVLSAAIALPLLVGFYLAVEPTVAVGQGVEESFTVSQEITGEIAFEVAPNDVTMAPTIPGISGGSATGSTPFTVSTNNPAGYTVTIEFEDTDAMQYNDGSSVIPDIGSTVYYTMGDGVAANEAAFAFTVTGDNTVSALLDDGATCGSGTATADTCWTLPPNTSTTPFTIVDSSTDTPSGGVENEVHFSVLVNSNPNPSLPLGIYTATATLTAVEK